MIDAATLTKDRYRIEEVAALLGESVPTVRYWTERFGVRHERDGHQRRLYARASVVKLDAARQLVRDWRFTIDGAKRVLSGAVRR